VKVISLTLPGSPRTKKTSNRILRFGRNKEHVRVAPSEAYEEWLAAVLKFGPAIHHQLSQSGVSLPLRGALEVSAIFYRDRASASDLTGLMQAVGDALQAPMYTCQRCRKRSYWRECCGALKLTRKGLGIILDDAQIESWDGTRRELDRDNPRIEVQIALLDGPQMSLLEEGAGDV
jgi:hypothetical protein